ncbi:MAG: cytochrome c [Alphaproteobacteria bacterium]|jgi:mono/diheme cytochrome c family protein
MSRHAIAAALGLCLALQAAGTSAAAEVEQMFKFYCAQCHGLEGKGDGPNVGKDFPVSPRNFTSAEEMNKLTDADIKNVILDGGPSMSKSPMMPPWGKTLSETEVDALIKHLRKLCACKGKQG